MTPSEPPPGVELLPRGYPHLLPLVHLDLFRLVVVFSGSRGFAEHAASHPRSTLYDLPQIFEKAEAARLLLSIAVIARNEWDRMGSNVDPLVLKFGGDSVGTIQTARRKAVPLHFREACHKIIHATEIDFTHGKARGVPFPFLKFRFGLTGEKGGRTWRAKIDVFAFAECAYNLLYA